MVPSTPRVPEPVGAALRAVAHGDPHAPAITATFEWSADEGLPRPAGEHYHIQRASRPDVLVSVPASHPLTLLNWVDTTPASPTLPTCHYIRVHAADWCEQEEAH